MNIAVFTEFGNKAWSGVSGMISTGLKPCPVSKPAMESFAAIEYRNPPLAFPATYIS